LENYWFALLHSKQADLKSVFKVVSLWFNNDQDEEVNQVLLELAKEVPSYKFVPLTYQISSRIGNGTRPFQKAIKQLVKRLCLDHPYHTLVQIFAIKNAKNVVGTNKGKSTYKKNLSEPTQMNRMQTAISILDDLKKENNEISELVQAMSQMVTAYIDLANADTSELQKKSVKDISFDAVKVKGSSRFDQCLRDRSSRGSRKTLPAVISNPPPVDPSASYPDVVRVQGFSSTFSVTESGIHRPKIILCRGTDGVEYRQLVKGEDDLRQDAVMEQVFSTVNSLLAENAETRKRKLHITTYNIVPLSPDSGVLEWVENTQPFGAYLTDARNRRSVGAHTRYYPDDYSHTQCRTVLKNATDKQAAFEDVCRHFHPAFRFFFLENFPDPYMWYNSRLNYTRSVAVSSIVGNVLGIGDRHANNILVHQKTAEVVHIDFGVTFEQGKILQTPETVPFRLTRDIIDGMGVTGTEGLFRRSCEKSMQVLRDNTESLLIILEVFMHDPLYKWMLSPLKARAKQKGEEGESLLSSHSESSRLSGEAGVPVGVTIGSSSDESDAARRVLTRIKQKLQGYEDPNGNAMSVKGQVKFLINEAQSTDNLCRLFVGWAPWL